MAGLDDSVHIASGTEAVKCVDMDGTASGSSIAGGKIIFGINRASIEVKVGAVTGEEMESVKSIFLRKAGVKTVEDGAERIRENLALCCTKADALGTSVETYWK